MELRCRCHGLSGSCSLKTCWLTLPNFQVIGAYLKKKYENSIHLPTAVNVNKLIPMMDKNEISAILSSQHQQVASNLPPPDSNQQQPRPEYAPLVAAAPQQRAISPASSVGQVNKSQLALENQANQHYDYYERHKFLQMVAANQLRQFTSNNTIGASIREQAQVVVAPNETTPDTMAAGYQQNSLALDLDENLPADIKPMSQQQYQALLKEIKLCNSSTVNKTNTSYLTTRDLNGSRLSLVASQPQEHQAQNSNHKRNSNNNNAMANQQQLSGHYLRVANQHLSQALHSNRDDLIHLHKSPDYCEADSRHGFAGIKSRVCSDNPMAPDNCDKLCCGRGHTVHRYQHSYKCDCKFQYCCSIWCSVCEKEIKVLVCN